MCLLVVLVIVYWLGWLVTSQLSEVVVLGAAKIRHHVTESKITFRRILVFVCTRAGLQVISHIFPASATDHFPLQHVCFLILSFVNVVRVEVMLKIICRLVVGV